MQTLSRLSLLLTLLVTAVLWCAAPPAFAQESTETDLSVQRERVRKLSPEEKRRLKAALARFESLSDDERRALRKKANELGRERLEELASRGGNAKRLRTRHKWLESALKRVYDLLGPERFKPLPREEQAYLAYEAKRRFQNHCRFEMLKLTGIHTPKTLEKLTPEQRKATIREALQSAADRLLSELPESERTRILALPPHKQRRERHKMVQEFRDRETVKFARRFDRNFLEMYFRQPEDRRQQRVRRFTERARWFEVRRLLEKELGVPRSTVNLIKLLRADEQAELRREYEETADLGRSERRLHLEAKIHELHGRAALDSTRGSGGEKRRSKKDEQRAKRRAARNDPPR